MHLFRNFPFQLHNSDAFQVAGVTTVYVIGQIEKCTRNETVYFFARASSSKRVGIKKLWVTVKLLWFSKTLLSRVH